MLIDGKKQQLRSAGVGIRVGGGGAVRGVREGEEGGRRKLWKYR